MYGGRLTFRQWLLGLAPDSSNRPSAPGRSEATSSLARRSADPLRPPTGEGDTSRSGSPNRVNATSPAFATDASGRTGNEGSRAGSPTAPAMTLPARRVAGPNRDRVEGTAAARGIAFAIAVALIVAGVAIAAAAPLTAGRTNGLHMWAPVPVALGGLLLARLLYATRNRT